MNKFHLSECGRSVVLPPSRYLWCFIGVTIVAMISSCAHSTPRLKEGITDKTLQQSERYGPLLEASCLHMALDDKAIYENVEELMLGAQLPPTLMDCIRTRATKGETQAQKLLFEYHIAGESPSDLEEAARWLEEVRASAIQEEDCELGIWSIRAYGDLMRALDEGE